MNKLDGTIYNIQSYSIHDGPGIRAVVFLKGCGLRCRWCSNPESQNHNIELYYSEARCIKCGLCVSVCPKNALTLESSIEIDRDICDKCGKCVEVCPTEAISFSGKIMTPEEVVEEVKRDWSYMVNSGGGVTFSGGEPFEQPEFLKATAAMLKEQGFHVAVETSGSTPYEDIEKCLDHIDLFLFDLKTGTSSLHERVIGLGNETILDNLAKVCEKASVIIRIPIIPGVNDTDSEISQMIKSISDIDPKLEVNLLPYHSLGSSKYKAVGQIYKMDEIEPPSDEYMQKILSKFLRSGINAIIV